MIIAIIAINYHAFNQNYTQMIQETLVCNMVTWLVSFEELENFQAHSRNEQIFKSK
jgi:hypothetical protein